MKVKTSVLDDAGEDDSLTGGGNTDWYSADAYCSEKGGYLAEPASVDEHNFIVNFARFVVYMFTIIYHV